MELEPDVSSVPVYAEPMEAVAKRSQNIASCLLEAVVRPEGTPVHRAAGIVDTLRLIHLVDEVAVTCDGENVKRAFI